MPDEPAARLGELARDATGPRADDEHLDRQLEARLVRELAGRRVPSRGRPGAWVAGLAGERGLLGSLPQHRGLLWSLAAAGAVVAVVLAVWLRGAAPLAWSVDGATASHSGYVRTEAVEAAVTFADGTRCVLAPRSVVRIEDVGEHGARLLVEDGRLDGRFAHLPGARWAVLAGPYTVTITGTDVGVSWSASGGALDVQLREGSVEVRGPHAEAGVPLAAGQRLRASPARGEIDIRPLLEPSAASTASASSTSTGVAGVAGGAATVTSGAPGVDPEGSGAPASAGSASAVGSASAEAGRGPMPASSGEPGAAAVVSWSQRVAKGDFAGVVADAEARGIDGVVGGAGAADLAALADAARYTGRGDLARRALLSARSRFGGSTQARTAAFLLGLLADARSPSEAASWYATYLAESPSGAYAAEALGRQMLAVKRQSGAAARPLAERYLVRFPNGPHAPVARELVSSP